MCEGNEKCERLTQLEQRRKKDFTKYWSVISGLVALLITIVIFYANSLHAMDQVHDHEIRIRNIEKSVIATETTLKEINRRLTSIDTKLERRDEK